MTRGILRLVLVVIAMAITVPAFAFRGGSGGQSCEVCDGFYSEEFHDTAVYCRAPQSGSSGNTNCHVECTQTEEESAGFCNCVTDGDWCYYIVVIG